MSESLSNLAPPPAAEAPVPAAPQPAPVGDSLVACPSCRRSFQHEQPGPALCPYCRWTGHVYRFTPLPVTIERSEQAVGEDATCIHHPTKRATAVCAGTGDYICALCAVELDGQTYSAAYLQTAGKAKVNRAFDLYLDRPDNLIFSMLGITPLMLVLAIFTMPYSFILYLKMQDLRRNNPRYARLVGTGRAVTLLVGILFFSLLFVAWAVVMILVVMKS